jgi:hypothetical protein
MGFGHWSHWRRSNLEVPEPLPLGSGTYQNPPKWLSGWVVNRSSPHGDALAHRDSAGKTETVSGILEVRGWVHSRLSTHWPRGVQSRQRGVLTPVLNLMSGKSPDPRLSPWMVLAMLAMIAVPAGITLHTVRVEAVLQVPSANPTPYGYSWSLLLFVVPIVVIGWWFLPSEGLQIPQRSFWRTISILVPFGFALDFFFANRFFVYPNAGATVRIGAPAIGGNVPIEEYVFYFTGFVAVLLIYIWLGEYWLAAYNVPDYAGEAKKIDRLLKFHPSSLFVGLLLIGVAILYKKLRSPYPDGLPGYFIVLVMGGLIPSVSFFSTARRLINWRAFSLTIFMILLISLFWEATLAVPYGWWGYQPKEMMGLFIGAWAGLPVEAVTVWIAVTYGTTIIFEIVKVWQASGKRARHSFLGRPTADAKS